MQQLTQFLDDGGNTIHFLETHPSIQNVTIDIRDGVTQAAINSWEKVYHLQLPADYKAFLLVSDGLLVRWWACPHKRRSLVVLLIPLRNKGDTDMHVLACAFLYFACTLTHAAGT